MALGFSVDYNAHVAYHFVSSKVATPELRVIDALSKIGGSVFLGGLSTFIGMMPTGFASSTVFKTFFKMFVGIVVLGLVHGLAILPVYLTLLGKIFDFREININSIIIKWFKYARKQKSFKTTNTNLSVNVVKAKNSIPAAIVGIGCRFPGGATSKDAFWDMLVDGRCGIGSYPTNRPNSREFIDCFNPGKDTPGKHYVLTGAFLEKIAGLDAQFFGISQTECRSMDPQQRILLQVVYEAIEDAGMRLEDLQQSRTGVYVGLMNLEYGSLVLDSSNIRKVDQFSSTGCAMSVLANRISFSFNLTGPSLTLDTACSSSLVAFDVAFGHLQTGECDVAIVCAANILLTGNKFHTACCRTGLLAQDGRCKSFDIKGDGYGRGEGVAAVVIKPTKTALDDRDDIYAEVVACGVNNDGKTAIPITAPSEVTQSILFQRVLQESGFSKDDIQYVEAHGTGTAVGDVVEMGSLATVYGNSSNRILRLGSVKSNINHTESTAGLAGLIKTCLMIKYGRFVPTINVSEVKPQLKMSERRMMVQVCNEPWNTDGRTPRTAAVSSYGFGGANAHVIVREVTENPVTVIPSRSISSRVMTLSAASKDALRAMARKVSQSFKEKPDDDELLKDNICYSLNERYTVHSHRLALSFSSFENAARALEKFADQEIGWEEFVATGDVTETRNKVVFLYGGQGAQWYGMAREMLVHEPKFKESIEKVDALLDRYKASWSLITELNKPAETSRLHENPIGQTALFAIHFALTELLESWGVTPSAVLGHSLGEISAAWACGALRLDKALQLVLFRSQLHEKCSPTGCMAAIGLSEEDARSMLQDLQLEYKVDVAAINSPGNVVLAGDKALMEVVEKHVKSARKDVFWKKLATTRAYHSREMEEIRQSYFKLTSEFHVRQTPSNIPFYSTVVGSQLSGQLLSLEHWWKNIRQVVLLEPALKAMFSNGYQLFIEINAAPQLSYHVRQTWSHNQTPKSISANDAIVVQTLPKRLVSQQHLSFLQNCVAHLFTNGVPLSWNKVQGSGSKSFFPRPTYPWQETEFWYRDEHPSEFVTFLDQHKTEENKTFVTFHPLLGKTVPTETFTGLHAWESEINLHNVSYINDHKFAESSDPVIPAAVYIEIILAMSIHLSPNAAPDVHNISFNNMLTISSNDSYRIRTRLLPKQCHAEENQFQITVVEDNKNEVILSEGYIQLGVNDGYGSQESSQQGTPKDFEDYKCAMTKWSKNDLKTEREKLGFAFGPQFDLITDAWSNGTEVLALICPTEEINKEASAYVIHPSVIDASLQTMLLFKDNERKFVPQKITHITIVGKPTCIEQFYAHAKIIESDKTPNFNITLMDRNAKPVMIFEKFIVAEISAEKTKVTFENTSFTFGWEKLTPETPATSQGNVWLLLRDQSKFAERFSQNIPAGESVHFVDIQDTSNKTCDIFSEVLEEVLRKMKSNEKLLVINFWPVDASKFNADTCNFDASHGLAFESCLSISQEIIKREAFAKIIQLVFVTSGLVIIPQPDRNPTIVNSNAFPWSASVFGFRRTFSEEITAPNASVVDLPNNPSDNDFYTMVEDVRKTTIEEEIVYRDGIRYVNRFRKLHLDGGKFTKEESPLTKDGAQKPFKMTKMRAQWFLQKTSNKRIKGKMKIEVYFACPILQKPWLDLKLNDRVTFAGKFCNGYKEQQNCFVVGVCKIDDLGNYVDGEKCCFTEIEDNVTAQQAASLSFPLAMSYHILTNLLSNMQGKKVFIHHRREEICCIFACVAMSLDINVVCLVKDGSSKDRIKKFGDIVLITADEMARSESNGTSSLSLDAVCLLSDTSTHVSRQIMKHLKPGAYVVTVHGEENVRFNPFIHDKDVQCIMTSLEDITDNSKNFSKLLGPCCSVLKSRSFFERISKIPQLASNIYDVTNDKSKNINSPLEREKKICLYTVSLKPKDTPDKVSFYSLPLDGNGLKDDRTYLVIGGVRGFGFEVAKWMVKNGAKTVMCTARSAASKERKADVQRLQQDTGSQILLRQADVTSWKDMNIIKEELEHLPAVAGIVFTAMVLADQLLKDADLKTCKKVAETKMKGSVILHQLSLSMDLDFFITFSSISGVLGNVGQVAYAAANSFMDQLCEYRRHKLGLPALSVNWGPISGTGVLERNTDITSILETNGLYALHYTTAIEFLKRILLENTNEAQICISAMNWQVYLQNHASPRLQMIREETLVAAEENNVMTLEDLALQPLELRKNYVQEFIKRLLSSWSGADVAELDLNVGLHKYGIDSIAATNMKLQIRNNIGATFETYYFIQPKTSGLTIINEILKQISKSFMSKNVIEEEGEAEGTNGLELQAVRTNKEKVVPLHTPNDAVVKVFMIHGSQKSALALATFALGFQQQIFPKPAIIPHVWSRTRSRGKLVKWIMRYFFQRRKTHKYFSTSEASTLDTEKVSELTLILVLFNAAFGYLISRHVTFFTCVFTPLKNKEHHWNLNKISFSSGGLMPSKQIHKPKQSIRHKLIKFRLNTPSAREKHASDDVNTRCFGRSKIVFDSVSNKTITKTISQKGPKLCSAKGIRRYCFTESNG
ncbi:Phthiocerol synthesis polyketide synthase type I, partial [Paramuricea clavata]